jgi:hypothetical protein
MPPQYCHRASVSSPFRVGKHKSVPYRQSELHGDFRSARREPIRFAMRVSFSESVGCQGLKRMIDSIVLPFACTTPSKGQLAIVASAKKNIYKPREIDGRRRFADQTGDQFRKIYFFFICFFFQF